MAASAAHALITLLRAPGHPLCLAATALLLANDHLLKARFPGQLTGKLSDLAWLVVAPVALAALLALVRVPTRWARIGAMGAVGVAFTALQLWPPLGEAWCAVFGGHHVADAGDLCCLPALAGAGLCWRRAWMPRAPRRWALVLAAGACLATRGTWSNDRSWRYPCDGTEGWSPAAPLVLRWADEDMIDPAAPGFAESMKLMDQDGRQVSVLLSVRGDGLLVLCPVGGLEPGRTYLWWIRDVEYSYHHIPGPNAYFTEAWTLSTGPEDSAVRARTQATCDALPLPEEAEEAWNAGCDPCGEEDSGSWSCDHPDTGDTGVGDDTQDSGDTGDTGDDSGDSGADTGGDTGGDTGDDSGDSGADTGGDTGEPGDTGLSPLDTGDGGAQ